ncbi:VWA domain-containing protein [Pseudolabrys taiwanensis]|uniref:VWA domain-containing protein n=1 Tax=Pseudolabrys taiwanensis TaxID=331696 RepID=A0A345ZS47_9HYPH|nr:TadE/TadG family type IV pilus assembly protein [Pseudolabrys taiwanensis]AXK79744.1 VWA domain-containing protein [Pseudolabrys taiwanensis]
MRPALSSSLRSIARLLARFGRARDGNVAIIFGMAAVPLVLGVGAAVDYSRANSVKTSLQTALDATALMLSRNAASLSASDLQSKADSYFKAMFTRGDVSNINVTATYSAQNGSNVVVNGSVQMPNTFMSIAGPSFASTTISGSSTTTWGSTRLRVALVLDNTGSMAQAGKMTALKSATKTLLTTLQAAASTPADVYVSIIPFVKDVNLGTSYTSNWIYWGTKAQDPSLTDNTSWDANNGTCSRGSSFSNRGDCVAKPVCSISWATSKNTCQSYGGTWYTSAGTWTPKAHSTWTGCVVDRGYPASPSTLNGKSGPDSTNNYDTNAAAPDATKPSSLYAAEQYSSCPQASLPLSNNWTAMNTLVDNMVSSGNTNQAIGLQVGWLSLVGGGPFTVPAQDPNYTYQQIIILLTDGLNTENRWYSDQASIDARQQLTCNNIKAAKITLYTIQVNTGGDPTSTLLQNCASSSDKFFLSTSASGIATAFNQIGSALTQLRVAK